MLCLYLVVLHGCRSGILFLAQFGAFPFWRDAVAGKLSLPPQQKGATKKMETLLTRTPMEKTRGNGYKIPTGHKRNICHNQPLE